MLINSRGFNSFDKFDFSLTIIQIQNVNVRTLLFFLLILFNQKIFAQANLLPAIGTGMLPNDSDSICPIPWYLGSFYNSGLQVGDTAYDFVLFDLNGDSLHLQTALSYGRPVLLIAGSYTCPVFRGKVPVINNLISTYAGLLDVYIIYTIEAHPVIDTSVYFGYVNTTSQNQSAGILYQQPDTYGERKNIVSDMLSNMTIVAPVFMDGVCNDWWNVFGPAPNNSYLIDTSGIVISKHGWFDRYPDQIYCDLDSLFGTNSGHCTGVGNSQFDFHMNSSDTMYGAAGTTVSIDASLTNTGTQDILIYARRLENNLPPSWASSMCIDVCYSSSTDSVVFLLHAGTTQAVHVYFYTSSNAGTGHVKMGFRNLSDSSNKSIMHAFAITNSSTGIEPIVESEDDFSIITNPVGSVLELNVSSELSADLFIYNLFGELVLRSACKPTIDISAFEKGIYFIKMNNTVRKFVKL